MNAARVAAATLLLAGAPLAVAEDGHEVEGSFDVGYTSFSHREELGTRRDSGVALGLRVQDRFAPHLGVGLSFTWGLADWARAREWVDAGNRAGRWTTDELARVDAWARKKDARQDTRGLRWIGAFFADLFLVMTYVAVPTCYVGSVGGATSYLQLDGTVSFHVAPPRASSDGWLEAGVGAATLPILFDDWRSAWGPVAGLGMRVGSFRAGARVLWSPSPLNESVHGGPLVMSTVTVGVVR